MGLVAHALLTRPPLEQIRIATPLSPLDLHVLGTPPAFVLSQNQTLMFNFCFASFSSALAVSLKAFPSNTLTVVLLRLFLYRFQGSSLKRA